MDVNMKNKIQRKIYLIFIKTVGKKGNKNGIAKREIYRFGEKLAHSISQIKFSKHYF